MNEVALYCLDNLKMCFVELHRIPKEGEFICINDIYFKVEKIIHDYAKSSGNGPYTGRLDIFVRNVDRNESILYSNIEHYERNDVLSNLL